MENATENTSAVENTTENTEETKTATEKTFTQAELDSIVQKRVSEERSKLEEYKAKAAKLDEIEEANKSELQKAQDKAAKLEKELTALKHEAEIREIRAKVSSEKGVPAELLTGETKEACESQADSILKFAQVGHPYVVDGGEVKTTAKQSTANQFADWMSKNTK